VKNAQKIARSTAMELAIDHQSLTRIDNQKIAHMPSFCPAQRSTNHAPVVIQSHADASRIELKTKK
jgi:hypothetical protein